MDTYDDSDDDDDDDSENGKTKKPFKSFHGTKTPVPLQAKELLDGGMLDGSRTNSSSSSSDHHTTASPHCQCRARHGRPQNCLRRADALAALAVCRRTASHGVGWHGARRPPGWTQGALRPRPPPAPVGTESQRGLPRSAKGYCLVDDGDDAAVGTNNATTKNTATQNSTSTTKNQKRGSSSKTTAPQQQKVRAVPCSPLATLPSPPWPCTCSPSPPTLKKPPPWARRPTPAPTTRVAPRSRRPKWSSCRTACCCRRKRGRRSGCRCSSRS